MTIRLKCNYTSHIQPWTLISVDLFTFLCDAGSDYVSQPIPDILRLDVNNTSRCVRVNITDDNIVEGFEFFHVEFNETEGSEVMIAGTNRANVTIEDNDGVL